MQYRWLESHLRLCTAMPGEKTKHLQLITLVPFFTSLLTSEDQLMSSTRNKRSETTIPDNDYIQLTTHQLSKRKRTMF